jgi:hypothetical protein
MAQDCSGTYCILLLANVRTRNRHIKPWREMYLTRSNSIFIWLGAVCEVQIVKDLAVVRPDIGAVLAAR